MEITYLVLVLEQTRDQNVSGPVGLSIGKTESKRISVFSKIQRVVYHQCCVLIGLPTTRLSVIAPSGEKSAGFLAAKKD